MTSNNAFGARTCIVVVVVTNESSKVAFFPEVGNLNGSNAYMCSDVSLPQPPGRLTLDPALDPVLLLAAVLDLNVTTTPILPLRASYVIRHKFYYKHLAFDALTSLLTRHQSRPISKPDRFEL